MFDVNEMLQREASYYDLFTNRLALDGGIIYHNPLNPQSHDSNHAHILELGQGIDSRIQEIIRFYRSRGISPRVYPSYLDHELEILRPGLERYGFTITVYRSTFMHVPLRPVPPVEGEPVRRITEISDEVIELIHTEESGDWSINVLKTAVKHERFHLLGLLDSGKCVSIASVRLTDGYSRVDDVKTHKAFRGRHFATRLISYLVSYHAALSNNHLYLWSDNPIAIRMYANVGFREIPINKDCWSAYIP